MRVIAGHSRGRRLPARLPPGVRPTSDRVRESIFDILGSMGGVEGLSVVDLFCGSGALGIEARSRGAARVTFVDRDPAALDAVRANLAAVGLDGGMARLSGSRGGMARLSGSRGGMAGLSGGRGGSACDLAFVRAELPGWLATSPHFDLALCDPPYDFDQWGPLLAALRADVAVLESSREVCDAPVPDRWMVTKSRRYGGTLVTVLVTAPPPAAGS